MAKDKLWRDNFADAEGVGRRVFLRKGETAKLNIILQTIHSNKKEFAHYGYADGLEHIVDLLEHLIEWQPAGDSDYLIRCVDVVEILWFQKKHRRLIMEYNIINGLFPLMKPMVLEVAKRNIDVIGNIQYLSSQEEYPWMDLIDYVV